MDSPFKQYWGTNYLPSTEEIDQINAYLLIKEKQLAETQLSLEEITCKRDSLRESQIESDRAQIFPAQRLPCELIEEIFLQCLPSKSNAAISSREAPIKLTQICRVWRGIAVSLPPLWSSIHIQFTIEKHSDFTQTTYRHYEAVQLWLQRSGSYPLSISVRSDPGRFNANVVDLFARQLLSVSNRWKNIYLQVTIHILEKFEQVSLDNLRNLETLQIHAHRYDAESTVDISIVSKSKLWKAPNLQKITAGYTEKFVHLRLRWGQFTELNFGSLVSQQSYIGFSPARALWLLSQTTNLIKFNFALHNGEDCNVTTPPVVLPHLKYFGVRMNNSPDTIIFQKLQLSSLKHIKYVEYPFQADERVANSHPICLLLLSGPTVSSVESLYISDPLLKPEVFKSILLLVPKLLRLSLISPVRGSATHKPDLCLRLLISPSDQPQCLSPLLERLTIKGHRFSDAVVLDVARTRSLKLDPLHIVHASFEQLKASNNIEEGLSILRCRGMKIRFSYVGDPSYFRRRDMKLPPPLSFDDEDKDDEDNGSGNN